MQQAVGLHHQTYYVSIARTPEELQRGLSGTDSLAANRAMLFVFQRQMGNLDEGHELSNRYRVVG